MWQSALKRMHRHTCIACYFNINSICARPGKESHGAAIGFSRVDGKCRSARSPKVERRHRANILILAPPIKHISRAFI